MSMPDLASVGSDLQSFKESVSKIKQTWQQGGSNRSTLGMQIRAEVKALNDPFRKLRQSLDSLDSAAEQSGEDEATKTKCAELRNELLQANSERLDLESRSKSGSAQGAEMQPVAKPQVPSDLESQREFIHSRDNEQLRSLHSSISRVGQVASANSREIQTQIGLLSAMDDSTDRSTSRARRLVKNLTDFILASRNRWLTFMIFILLIAIIVLFVYLVMP